MPRNNPVWGFPTGHNPNYFSFQCERCRTSNQWISKPTTAPAVTAWICRACTPSFEPNYSPPPKLTQIPD